MLKYALHRILILFPVVLSVMFILYTILYFTPGDPARIALPLFVMSMSAGGFVYYYRKKKRRPGV